MQLTRTILSGLMLATLIFTSSAHACDALLRASPEQLLTGHLVLPTGFQNLRDMMNRNVIFPVETMNEGFYTMVFDPRTTVKNEGYILRGYRQGHQFIAMKVKRSTADDERRYFHAVAQMHGLKPEVIRVSNSRGEYCSSIVAPPWIQAKLWLKHSLRMEDVRKILQEDRGERDYSGVGGLADHRSQRYRVTAVDKFGLPITIVIAETKECPFVLVTAFND